MSHEHAKELINKLSSNKSFRDELFSIKGLDERMHHIAQKGFNVTIEEIELAFKDYRHQDPEVRCKQDLFGVCDDILQLIEYVVNPF